MDQNLNTAAPIATPDPNKVLDQLTAAQQTKKKSIIGFLILALALPPFTTVWAMYLSGKRGTLYQLMPILTIVSAVVFALWSLLMFSASGAFSDYLHQQVLGVPTFDKVIAILLTAGGIISGIYFRIRANRDGKLGLIWVGLMSVILLLQIWAGAHQLSFISAVVGKAQDTNIGL